MDDLATSEHNSQRAQDNEVLVRYGVRWAVIAAWHDELSARAVGLPTSLPGQLESCRVKIASGCFSSCEVGCDLGALEAELTAADASSSDCRADYWIDLLGNAMQSGHGMAEALSIPTVKALFNDCERRGCACAG